MDTKQFVDLYADPGPFATAYIDVGQDQEDGNKIVDLRVREVGDELARLGASASIVEALTDRLGTATHEPAPVSRCVVATERGVLLDRLARKPRVHGLTSWGPLPDLGAYLEDADVAVPFILALVDHEGGDVSTYSADPREDETETSVGKASTYEHKTRGGGSSHLRHQRSAEGVWGRNAEAVATEIERQVKAGGPDLVIIAGDVHSRNAVTEKLPNSMSAQVEVLEHGGRATDGGDDALTEEVESVLRGFVVSKTLATVHELKQRMGLGRSMAVGVADVADAFVLGQVHELLIDPEKAAGFTLRLADHPGLALGSIRPEEELRADQALIASAALTDADIVVTRAGTMGDAPVAALLRWDQETDGIRG